MMADLPPMTAADLRELAEDIAHRNEPGRGKLSIGDTTALIIDHLADLTDRVEKLERGDL
jgi:hypothetical protein